MRFLVGECMCDHWGGKEPWPGGYAEEPQRGEPFEQSLNPGGLLVWLAMLLSMLGHNLKGDQRAVPQSSKALFLPPHRSLSCSLSLKTLSLSIFSILLQTTVHFTGNSGQKWYHLCTKCIKYTRSFLCRLKEIPGRDASLGKLQITKIIKNNILQSVKCKVLSATLVTFWFPIDFKWVYI